MEGNYLTAGELALIDQRRGYGYDYDGYHQRRKDGTATTGVALAAGLGGGALLLAIAGIWGMNQASKARSKGNAKAIDILAQQSIVDRQARENWQNVHAPSMTQYVDVRTGAAAGSASNALSNAEAIALAQAINNNSGLSSAIGGCNFLRVARYSAPRPCGCDSCEG